jgi:hypothetical protein
MANTKAKPGNKLKSAINGMTREDRIEALEKAIFIAANRHPGDGEANYAGKNTTELLSHLFEGHTSAQLEDYADACKILIEVVNTSDVDTQLLMPRYFRDNLPKWLDKWNQMFYALSAYHNLEALHDFEKVSTYLKERLSEEDILSLEAKYILV